MGRKSAEQYKSLPCVRGGGQNLLILVGGVVTIPPSLMRQLPLTGCGTCDAVIFSAPFKG